MMRPFRILLACAALSVATSAAASWFDSMRGVPIAVQHPTERIGATEMLTRVVEDDSGRVFVGADGLFEYDGSSWKRHGFGTGYQLVNALALAGDGRVLCGGLEEFGYFASQADGTLVYQNLSRRLPAEHREFNIVWACGEFGKGWVYFAKEKVMVWDGAAFRVWSYATKTRLYPVRIGARWFFTHQETGFYELTGDGPMRLCGKEGLSPRAPLWAELDGDRILLASSNGLFPMGQPESPLWSQEVSRFLERSALIGVERLDEGGYLVATMAGLALVTPDGRLARTFSKEDGFPVHTANGFFRGRDGRLWFSTAHQGLYRIDRTAIESAFTSWEHADVPVFNALAAAPEGIYAATDRGVYFLKRDSTNGKFQRQQSSDVPAAAVLPLTDGLLVGRFGTAEIVVNDSAEKIFSLTGTLVSECIPTRHGGFLLQHNGVLARVWRSDATWHSADVPFVSDYARQVVEDERGRWWIATAEKGIYVADLRNESFQAVQSSHDGGGRLAVVTTNGRRVFAVVDKFLYAAEVGDDLRMHQLAELPVATALRISCSADGREVWVAFSRVLPDGTRGFGVGVAEVDTSGQWRGWREVKAEGLAEVGTPRTQVLDEEKGRRRSLWLGGTKGLVRLDLANVRFLERPAPPEIDLRVDGVKIDHALPLIPFGEQRIKFDVFQRDLVGDDGLWYQTRIGDGEWTTAKSRAVEVSRLPEGTYAFAARVVNAMGETSEEKVMRFRVLPPWWRSPQAMLAYAALLIAAVVTIILVRERRSRERNRRLERLVDERTQELRKANAAKDEFLSNISHELRNPLNGIVGLASGIDAQKLDAVAQKKFRHLRSCADHLAGMMEDLLDFSKLEAGAVTLNPRVFNLPELVQSIASLTEDEGRKSGLPLDIAVAPSVPQWIEGDPARIRQILVNFVVNAHRYAGRGEILLTVWARPSANAAAEITFAVSDDGPGIPEAEVQKLFARFQRGSAAKERRVSGSGIGLSVCKTLAEKMGGRVWVESQLGSGTTFSFAVTLPRRDPPAARMEVAGRTLRHALVVDDEEYNLYAMTGLLEQLGFRVTLANNGLAAMAALHGEQGFDVVFLDYDLPDLDGPEVARRVRLSIGAERLPIVATTAFVTPDKHRACVEAGMNAVITKPLTAEKIAQGLETAVTGWRASASADFPLHGGSDPLAVLRLLAERKGIAFSDEVMVYLSEFDTEMEQMMDALDSHDRDRFARAAHKIVGRLGFVGARDEEVWLRRAEEAAIANRWEEAVELIRQLSEALPAVKERLMKAGESGRPV